MGEIPDIVDEVQTSWDDAQALYMIENDFAQTYNAFLAMISLYDRQTIDESYLWDYLAKTSFRSFTDHATQHWKVQLKLQDTNLIQLVSQLDSLAKKGNAAIAKKDLEEVKRIISEFNNIISALESTEPK